MSYDAAQLAWHTDNGGKTLYAVSGWHDDGAPFHHEIARARSGWRLGGTKELHPTVRHYKRLGNAKRAAQQLEGTR